MRIYGEGIERESLENYIEEHDMKYVSLKGYDVNVRSKLNEYALYILHLSMNLLEFLY